MRLEALQARVGAHEVDERKLGFALVPRFPFSTFLAFFVFVIVSHQLAAGEPGLELLLTGLELFFGEDVPVDEVADAVAEVADFA